MKIAIYKDNLSTGRGADHAVKSLAAGLCARGHDVVLFEKRELAERLAEVFDIIVATGSNEAVDLDERGYFNKVHRAVTLLSLHLAPCGFFKWKHPIRNMKIRRAFSKFDAVQVLCNDYVSEFRKIAPRPYVSVIGNWTDRLGISEARVLSSSSRIILYPAAALTRIKNQALAIKAFAKIAKDFPEWRLRLLGKAQTRYGKKCQRLIASLKIGSQISLSGFMKDLDEEYSRADFIAFPSKLEGFPLALLEAAQYALPAIVISDLPGVVDIVRDSKTGLVVKGTVREFAAGLRRLMIDDDYRHELGRQCHDYCARNYAREKILDQWEALLNEVVSQRR